MLKLFVKLLGWLWALLFLAYVANIIYESSGNTLPPELAEYRELVIGWLEAHLSPAVALIAFLIAWLAVSYHLGGESGWRKLANEYRETALASAPRFFTGSARIGKTSLRNALLVGADSRGLSLRMFVLMRIGNPNLNIPWSAIESIKISNSTSPESDPDFIDRLEEKMSASRYAHIRLSRFPEQTIVVPWNDELQAHLPLSLQRMVDAGR